MAVLIDIGEEGNLHPRNKRDAGERLARVALARDYGRAVAYSGPQYNSMQVKGDHIRIHFDHLEGGLVAKPLTTYVVTTLGAPVIRPVVRNSPSSPLEGFAICGDDHKWRWADAQIDHDTVVVSSSSVPQPVAVRYAWADDPVCNLYNGAGLPAVPFRTDDFPLITSAARFTAKPALP
jgi:sialate O-acetylesterase